MTCEMKVVLLFYDIEMDSLTPPTRITMTQIHELHLNHKWVLTTEVTCDVCCNLHGGYIIIIIRLQHTMAFTAGCPTEKSLSVTSQIKLHLGLQQGCRDPF